MAANVIAGNIVSSVGSGIKFGSNLLNTYMNYKIRAAQLKQQYANAQFNFNWAVTNVNRSLANLSENEYTMHRAFNSQMADIETSFVGAGVSSDSGTYRAVVDAQARSFAEQLTSQRSSVALQAEQSMLSARLDLSEAENSYKWGKKANKWSATAGYVNATTSHLDEMGQIWSGSGLFGGLSK